MKGSYVLVLDLAEDTRLTVGRLGTFEFPAGLYLYCGSALNGLEARIRRHIHQDKKRHWHVDYLTGAAPVLQVWWVADEERWECRWAEAIAGQDCEPVARGFGSSDCRCPAHLFRVGCREHLEGILWGLGNATPSVVNGITWKPRGTPGQLDT